LAEEEKLSTHLIRDATFIFCTYPLFIVKTALPLNGQREREVEPGVKRRHRLEREKEGKRE
jgi:hypothetical protein